MGDLTDDAMRRDVMSNWEQDVQAAHDENIRELEQRERPATDDEVSQWLGHACANEDLTEDEFDAQAANGEPVILLGKISPREAVILIKNITTVPGVHDYYADYLMQVREIIRRLDMKA